MLWLQVLPGDHQLIAACEDRSWSLWNIDQEKCCGQYISTMGGVRGVAAMADQVSCGGSDSGGSSV